MLLSTIVYKHKILRS